MTGFSSRQQTCKARSPRSGRNLRLRDLSGLAPDRSDGGSAVSDINNSASAAVNQNNPSTAQAKKDGPGGAISPGAAGWFGAGLIGLALICFLIVNILTPVNSLGSAALAGTAVLAIGLVALIVLAPWRVPGPLGLWLAIVFVSVASWTLGGLFPPIDPMGHRISEKRMARAEVEAFRKLYSGSEYIIGETDVKPAASAKEDAGPADGKPAADAAPADVVVTVYLKRPAQDPAVLDLAKQILTISATVLVTVVGFYFGSNSSAEAARTLKATLAEMQGGTGPATPDAVLNIASEIAGIGTDVGKKMTALGTDPMARLAAAVKSASSDVQDKMSRPLVEAQQLLDGLKAAQNDVIANADRAKEVSATVKPDSQSGDLLQSRDKLVALRTGAAEASRKFEQNLAAFTAARDAILQATAKG